MTEQQELEDMAKAMIRNQFSEHDTALFGGLEAELAFQDDAGTVIATIKYTRTQQGKETFEWAGKKDKGILRRMQDYYDYRSKVLSLPTEESQQQ